MNKIIITILLLPIVLVGQLDLKQMQGSKLQGQYPRTSLAAIVDDTLKYLMKFDSVQWSDIRNKPISSTGTVTSIATTSPIAGGPITTTGTISISESSTSSSGYLSATNFSTFNNKINGTGINGRVGLWSGASNLVTDALAWDYSSNKLGIGYTDTTALNNDLAGLAGLAINGTSSALTMRSASTWNQFIVDDNRIGFWTNAGGGSDKFKINYSNWQPNFKYLEGAGNRMVVADASGNLSSQAIPAAGPVYTQGTGIGIAGNVISNTGVVSTSGNGLSFTAGGAATLNTYMQGISSSSSTGIMVRTSGGATGGSAYRTLVAGTNISLVNANGVAGDITINATAGGGYTTSFATTFKLSTTHTFFNSDYRAISLGTSTTLGGGFNFLSDTTVQIISAGQYLITWSTEIQNGTTNETFKGLLMKGTNTYINESFNRESANSTQAIAINLGKTIVFTANANDIIKIKLSKGSTGNLTTTLAYTSLIITKI
jgi:trimeric autotransporter adhesin